MIKRIDFYHFDYSTLEFLGNILIIAIITGIAIIIFILLTTSVASQNII